MSCSLCRKVLLEEQRRQLDAMEAPEELPIYFTSRQAVVGLNSKRYALGQPLVPRGHFPRNGWEASVTVKGMPRAIQGTTPEVIFSEAERLLKLNGEFTTNINIWLNLNIQWTPRVAAKYQIISKQDLLKISTLTP